MTTTSPTNPANPAEVAKLVHASQTLLPPPARWPQVNTYPESLAEAIIDSIWSERVRYTNVVEVVGRYRDFRASQGGDADKDGAPELAASFDIGLDAWIERIGNRQRVFSRDDAPYKAEVVRQAAEAALAAGVATVADLARGLAQETDQCEELRRRWLALPSQGSGMSWGRLALAAGIETVPPKPWLSDFVSHAIGQAVTSQDALALVHAAAPLMGVTPFRLRNAIWIHQARLGQPTA
jgi:hypothetical protein